MEKATKRIRFTLDLDQEDYDLLEGLGGTKAVVLRKGIRLLDQLRRREVFVHTPKGDRIPTEIILS